VNVDRCSQKVERLIGWLTVAIGLSALQRNDSIAYRVMQATAPVALWVCVFVGVGVAMVAWSTTINVRARLVVAAIMFALWAATLAMVWATGPFGAIGGCSAVVCIYLALVIVRHLYDGRFGNGGS
jgi:hypothetical protein